MALPDDRQDRYREELVRFTEIAAHDLDGPLRKLSVLVDRLTSKYTLEDPDAKELATRIKSCLDNMRLLIDNLAMLSRITTEPLRYASCDMTGLFNELLKEFAETIENSRVKVVISPMPVLEADRQQLMLLFRNLLDNAFLFSKNEPAASIQVDCRKVTNEERISFSLENDMTYYCISVKDNGIGFDPGNAERIFLPFVRLHGKSEYPGTGLGLAVCQRVARNHNGHIYANAMDKEGATFFVILPEKKK